LCDRQCWLLSVIVGWNVAPMWPHGRRRGLLSSGSAVSDSAAGWRRRGPELCPGPRGAALLWACSPAGRPSRPLPPGRVGPGFLPWTWTGKRRAGQVGRSDQFRVGPLAAGRHAQGTSRQARPSCSGAQARCAAAVCGDACRARCARVPADRLPGTHMYRPSTRRDSEPAPQPWQQPRAGVRWLSPLPPWRSCGCLGLVAARRSAGPDPTPTRRGPEGLLTLARAGQGKGQGVPPGREACSPEGGVAWS
jgi:hypothetical protein